MDEGVIAMRDLSNSRYRMRGRVVVRKIGVDTLLVPVSGNAAGGRVYPVNETAAVVWTSLVADGTVHQAAEALVACFDVSANQAREDCEACVQAFIDEALLEEYTS